MLQIPARNELPALPRIFDRTLILKRGEEDPGNKQYAAFLESVYGSANEHLRRAIPKPAFLTGPDADAHDAELAQMYDVAQLGVDMPSPAFLDFGDDAAPIYAQIMGRMTQEQIERHKEQENHINGVFLLLEDKFLRRRYMLAEQAWQKRREYDLERALEYECAAGTVVPTTVCTYEEYWQRSVDNGLRYCRTSSEDSEELRFTIACTTKNLFGPAVLAEIGIGE